MSTSTPLYHQLLSLLSQHSHYRDIRHLKALAWIINALICSATINLSEWESYISLNNEEKQELEKILARHSTSQQVAKRAKIILLASEGKNHRQIARELDISRKMARLWRER